MIVAFTGSKGSGKDHAGKLLAEEIGLDVKSFADPIRFVVKDIFQLESDAEYDVFKRTVHDVKGRPIHGREIVRGIGMAMRGVNENFPTQYMDQFAEQDIVITDLRFDNELAWCKFHDVIIIKLNHEEAEEDAHISERGFDSSLCDGMIFNHKNVRLEQDVLMMVESIQRLRGTE
jgi:hypothetical protein